MKLQRLKVNSPFRGLHKGIELHFRQNYYLPEDIYEPICLVGLNGSGKSNVLEVICEIFYYLEIQNTASKKELAKINERYHNLGFEIEYSISRLRWAEAFSRLEMKELDLGKEDIVIRFTKPSMGKLDCLAYYANNNQKFTITLGKILHVLPAKVIAYSSGQNELISNPFIKLDFHYHDEFEKRKGDRDVYGALDVNRMFFMDYDSNQLVVLSNYLFQENDIGEWKERAAFNKKLKIEHLHSFSITIRYKDYRNNMVELPSELNIGIEKLKKCASLWTDNEETTAAKNKKNRVVEMSFYADAGARTAFRNVFKTPSELFRLLYLLRLLNIYCYGTATRNNIKNAPKGTNLSDLIPRPATEDLLFKIDGIMFRKPNATEPVAYKNLSDGEHQLLHVIGTLMLMQENDTLFILDEPETHFNPEWRAKMISLIMQNNRNNDNQQDYFITSHSPFIISDCKPDNVYIFNRTGNKVNIETAAQKRLNTFGASVNILTEEVFNKNESIADYSLTALNEIKNRQFDKPEDIQKAKEDARVLGDSVEKTLLFRKLLMLEDGFAKKKKATAKKTLPKKSAKKKASISSRNKTDKKTAKLPIKKAARKRK